MHIAVTEPETAVIDLRSSQNAKASHFLGLINPSQGPSPRRAPKRESLGYVAPSILSGVDIARVWAVSSWDSTMRRMAPVSDFRV